VKMARKPMMARPIAFVASKGWRDLSIDET